MMQTLQPIPWFCARRSTLMPHPSGSIRSSRIHSGRAPSPWIASATVAASDTTNPCLCRMRVIANRACRSSSTIRTDPFDDDLEATSPRACIGESNVGADVPSERFADCKAHPESFAAVSLIIVHLVELVEKIRNILVRNSNSGVGDAHTDLFLHRQLNRHSSLSGVLDRVVHEVADDSLQLLAIGR